MTAAARPPRGQCRPRAALPRPPRGCCRPPRSVAECYPVLNVTLTHSIPDTTALTSSIHAARAAIGRASRPGGAVLPLRPFITPGHRQRRRRGAGGAGGARAPGRLCRSPGRRSGRRPSASPVAPRLVPAGTLAWAAPPPAAAAAAPETSASQRRPLARGAWGTGEPGNRGLAGASRAPLPRAPSRIPSPRLPVGNASPSGRLGVFGFLEKDARKLEQWGEPKGCGRKEILHRKRPRTLRMPLPALLRLSEAPNFSFLQSIKTGPLFPA